MEGYNITIDVNYYENTELTETETQRQRQRWRQ